MPSKVTELLPDLFSVEVPEGAHKFNFYRVNYESIMMEFEVKDKPLFVSNTIRIDHYRGDLTQYKMPEIIGLFHELTEDQARELGLKREVVHDGQQPLSGHNLFLDYRMMEPSYFSPLPSLRSLLESKGLDMTKNYLLIKRVEK